MSLDTSELWQDERGFVISAELTLISTIVVLSMVGGMASLSNSITSELEAMSTPANPSQNTERYPTLGLPPAVLTNGMNSQTNPNLSATNSNFSEG